MPSSLVAEASAPPSTWRRTSRTVGMSLVAIVFLVVAVGVTRALGGPSFVEEVTVANPTDYAVKVAVSDGDPSWMGLGVVGRDDERAFRAVIDQRPTWVFEFSYAGHRAGQLEVDRDVLVEGGWRIEVPAHVGTQLAAQGFAPSIRGG